jgi:hypothetical protein
MAVRHTVHLKSTETSDRQHHVAREETAARRETTARRETAARHTGHHVISTDMYHHHHADMRPVDTAAGSNRQSVVFTPQSHSIAYARALHETMTSLPDTAETAVHHSHIDTTHPGVIHKAHAHREHMSILCQRLTHARESYTQTQPWEVPSLNILPGVVHEGRDCQNPQVPHPDAVQDGNDGQHPRITTTDALWEGAEQTVPSTPLSGYFVEMRQKLAH